MHLLVNLFNSQRKVHNNLIQKRKDSQQSCKIKMEKNLVVPVTSRIMSYLVEFIVIGLLYQMVEFDKIIQISGSDRHPGI
jgi:hypothetical protein